MGNMYMRPKIRGPNPYTRSGVPPPKLIIRKEQDAPGHRVWEPMSLQLHMADERIRTAALTPAERSWRQIYVADQAMHPDEPVSEQRKFMNCKTREAKSRIAHRLFASSLIHVDAVHRQMNPVRVIYRWPWDTLYKHFLRPTFGTYYGAFLRIVIPKYIWWYMVVLVIYYIAKYEQMNWQKVAGIRYTKKRASMGLYGDHDKDQLDFALSNPGKYNYYDKELMETFKMGDKLLDFGKPRRSW